MTRTDATHREESGPASAGDAATPSTRTSKSVADIQSAYARYAGWIDRLEWVDRLLTGRHRRRRFGDASGRVLDVACGTGTNFPYLPPNVDLVGVDVSPEMVARARETLADLPVEGSVALGDAQNLAFPADSFDTVVSALSTCTFPDPVAALREMARVCKPDGRILLLEHGRSDLRPLAWYQEWRADATYEKTGCRRTQEPLDVVARAGLPVVEHTTTLTGSVTAMTVEPRVAD